MSSHKCALSCREQFGVCTVLFVFIYFGRRLAHVQRILLHQLRLFGKQIFFVEERRWFTFGHLRLWR